MTDRLFLIDGHALIFKMYYAFLRRPMVNSKGADMSILYGFTKYVLELIEREHPTHLAVAFDPPGGTFRNVMYPAYKANRDETPQLVIDALEPLQELCHALGLATLMIPGYEADDVIGTVALRSADEGADVYMVTPDKDYGQLIRDHVFQLKPGKSGGADELVDSAAVCKKYGISNPLQVIEMLTLCGDTADNVPGVKGIGEVGAGKLISRYGSVENIYAHLDELSERQQAQFEEARGHIALSHELVTIKTDVPVETSLGDMLLKGVYGSEAADLFEKYEFHSLRRFLGHAAPPPKERNNLEVSQISPSELLAAAQKAGRYALIAENGERNIFAPVEKVTAAVGSEYAEGLPGEFKALLESDLPVVGYDLKYQRNILASSGITLGGPLCDIELMHYLTDPERSHKADILASSYLGIELEETAVEEAPADLFAMVEDAPEKISRGREAVVVGMLYEPVLKDMKDKGVVTLYEQIEQPLIPVLGDMERDGVKVDLGQIKAFAEWLKKEVARLEEEIRSDAGDPGLNISSPKQIGTLLFEKLGLDPKAKKSAKGAWTTDETTLLGIADRHPIVDKILDFRAVKKLLSTYIEPFPGYISSFDGKVHTTFNQALTATGRLSSSNPNLQNIPIRTERGKEIRKAFVPSRPDGRIVSADYSQIELRIMAHLCGDDHLVSAFRDGIDVHAATAAKIFGIPYEEVTADQRRIAKTANFGIMYGISSFGLAQRLRISRSEAKKIIDDYFAAFPSIRTYIDQTIAAARENGYVETLFGRRRYLPDITSKNGTVRALAERNAVNAPIQGTSADIIKIAMAGVARRLSEEGFRSRMVLQIHDELLLDAVAEEVDALKAMVKGEMEHVITLKVPLTVECNDGTNWLEAH